MQFQPILLGFGEFSQIWWNREFLLEFFRRVSFNLTPTDFWKLTKFFGEFFFCEIPLAWFREFFQFHIMGNHQILYPIFFRGLGRFSQLHTLTDFCSLVGSFQYRLFHSDNFWCGGVFASSTLTFTENVMIFCHVIGIVQKCKSFPSDHDHKGNKLARGYCK